MTVHVHLCIDFEQEMCGKHPTQFSSPDGGSDPIVSEPTHGPIRTHKAKSSTNKEQSVRFKSIPLRILNWNVEGLLDKVYEADFMQYVSDFDIICFTETFLERSDPLDCFPDFLQFSSPAVKLSQHGRSSGGVLVLVKRAWGKYVSVLDLSQYNMVWLKIELCFRVRNTLSCVVRMSRLFPRLQIGCFSYSLAEVFLAPHAHLLCQWNLGQ